MLGFAQAQQGHRPWTLLLLKRRAKPLFFFNCGDYTPEFKQAVIETMLKEKRRDFITGADTVSQQRISCICAKELSQDSNKLLGLINVGNM